MTELLNKSYHAERDGDIWNDDCVEIFISNHAFYHFIINSHNVNLDEKDNDASWNGLWESAVKTDHDYWQVEIKLPFHTIDMRPGDTEITLNFCREKYTVPSEISSWAYTAGQFINTQNYGRLKNIRRSLPDVAVKQIDWGSLLNGAHQIEMQLSNRSQTAWTGKAILEMKSADGELLASFPSKPLRLEPGQELPASIEYNDWQKEGSYIELITLDDQKSWPVLSKSVTLPPLISFMRMPVLLWQGEKGITLISLNAAQFTGYSVQATVKNAQGKIIQKMRQTPDNVVFTMPLPTDALRPGEYHLELRLFRQDQLLKTQTCQFEVIPGF
jgi:hypothetical protein